MKAILLTFLLALPFSALALGAESAAGESCPLLQPADLEKYRSEPDQGLYASCMTRTQIKDLGARESACRCVSDTMAKKLTGKEMRSVSAYYDAKISASCFSEQSAMLWEYTVAVGSQCVEN